jgi:hypothetical protein
MILDLQQSAVGDDVISFASWTFGGMTALVKQTQGTGVSLPERIFIGGSNTGSAISVTGSLVGVEDPC